ncbi:MAG: DNA polymerase IV [Candidatus Bipolaricaulota bacterium]|nr:MAG: DNA polymerase IV [Candidatus Bipolaricaulota bacterium]
MACEQRSEPDRSMTDDRRTGLPSAAARGVGLEGAHDRYIGHLDMDAFFAAVEQRDRPELRGRPVIVGGLGPRGVVSTASYEARVFGIGSAMPMSRARRLCPQGVFLSPRFSRYKAVSEQVRAILHNAASAIEPVSLDEAFFDLTARAASFADATKQVIAIKAEVERTTRLRCSVGLAPNRLLAKLASELAKPGGIRPIAPSQVRDLLDPLPVGRLPGVGPVTRRRLAGIGVQTVGQLRRIAPEVLVREFGQHGGYLHRIAHGEDETPVAARVESRSISREVTFPEDVTDRQHLEAVARELSADVARQLQQEKLVAKTVRIKVRFPDFRTETRQASFGVGIDSPHLLGQVATDLLRHRVEIGSGGLRLLGVGTGGLHRSAARQLSLFDETGWG